MASIIPKTTTIQDCDKERSLLAKILHRLNLSASEQPGTPAANVAVTNTPLPVEFDGSQPVHFSATQDVAVTNFPATQPVSGTVTVGGTVDVGNFPATQNVAVTNTPTVDVNNATFQDGHLSVISVPMEFEVAHGGTYLEGGVEKGAFIYRVLGRRAGFNSTSVLQDIGEFLGTSINLLPELTGVENLELVSSSAQDDSSPVGIGTWSVRIHYLSTSYVLSFVDYSLNGTAPIAVSEKMLFVYSMEALTGGTSEVSAGNIDLRISGGGAVHERITAGGNRSLSSRFMVPDNYKAYVQGWGASSIGTSIDFRLRATTTEFQNALNARYLFKSSMYLNAASETRPMVYKKLPARAKLKVSCLPGATAASNRADCEVIILLVQD